MASASLAGGKDRADATRKGEGQRRGCPGEGSVCAPLLMCVSTGTAPCRVRERRLEARNTALQLSTEQLERKIQTKVLSHVTYPL